MPVTREESGGDTEVVKTSSDEGETEVGEVVGIIFNRSKSYNIYFRLGLFVSHEKI